MAEQSDVQVQELFKFWRNGNADAGQVMARRFNDWYYAVATSRLGDAEARPALEQACAAFVEGIATVSRAADVVNWAHTVLTRHVHEKSPRITGGDFKNALTGERSPVRLLQQVRATMANVDLELLSMAYSDTVTDQELEDAAEATEAGWPMALLDARYNLKRSLKDNLQVGFSIVPIQPDLDCAPLPLYESARMETEAEEAIFEKWLISNEDLCRDLAEFATFAHALRAGALDAAKESVPRNAKRTRGSVFEEIHPSDNRMPKIAAFTAILGVLAILAGLVYVLFFSTGGG